MVNQICQKRQIVCSNWYVKNNIYTFLKQFSTHKIFISNKLYLFMNTKYQKEAIKAK